MEADPDVLAGVVDLFGALSREELRSAYADLAARSGDPFDADALEASVDRAVEGYYLVELSRVGDGEEPSEGGGSADGEDGEDGENGADESADDESESADATRLVAGPAALPTLPAGVDRLAALDPAPELPVST